MHATITAAAPTPTSTAADAPRFNPYVPIHKALRHFMMDTLLRLGCVDTADRGEMLATLAQLDGLLDFCAAHVQHENDFVHAAMEARDPGAAARTAEDHVEHLQAIDALRIEAGLLLACGDERDAAQRALRLYRHVALFVAENFQHMHVEETVNASSLLGHYRDDEIAEMHGRLKASIPPEQHLLTARWMVPAMSPAERAAMVDGMKHEMPPEALLGVLQHLRPHLAPAAWQRLCASARPGPETTTPHQRP